MERSSSWEAKKFSGSQEIIRILYKPNVHYRVHKRHKPVHVSSQRIIPSLRACATILNFVRFWGEEILGPPPTPKAWWPPHVGCLRLFIKYIHSYRPYCEAVFSCCNLRTRRALMTGNFWTAKVEEPVKSQTSLPPPLKTNLIPLQ
jgi:hypothetical protein